jgi:molecular chaperone GrpE
MTENAGTDQVDEQPAGDEAAAAGPANEPEAGAGDELAAARALAEENWNKYLRLAAEMENLRKRAARDTEAARKFGIERFAAELLAVVDSLEMGLEAGAAASVESLLEGKSATLKLLRGAMEKFDITAIEPEGEPFDPQLHEAMTMQPSDTAEPGSVLAVIQKGYVLNGRLLRPARVVVASQPESEEE